MLMSLPDITSDVCPLSKEKFVLFGGRQNRTNQF